MIALLVPSALAALLATTSSEAPPPEEGDAGAGSDVRWDASGAVPSVLGIVPGRHDLEAVRRAVGDAPRIEGDARRDAPPVRLCYVPADGGDPTSLVVDARGEVVEAYLLAEGAPPEVQGAPCAVSGRVWHGLVLSNGLRLGMTRAEAIARSGTPTDPSGGEVAWERWTGRVEADGTGLDGYEGMRLLFAGDRLVAIEAFRAEWRR